MTSQTLKAFNIKRFSFGDPISSPNSSKLSVVMSPQKPSKTSKVINIPTLEQGLKSIQKNSSISINASSFVSNPRTPKLTTDSVQRSQKGVKVSNTVVNGPIKNGLYTPNQQSYRAVKNVNTSNVTPRKVEPSAPNKIAWTGAIDVVNVLKNKFQEAERAKKNAQFVTINMEDVKFRRNNSMGLIQEPKGFTDNTPKEIINTDKLPEAPDRYHSVCTYAGDSEENTPSHKVSTEGDAFSKFKRRFKPNNSYTVHVVKQTDLMLTESQSPGEASTFSPVSRLVYPTLSSSAKLPRGLDRGKIRMSFDSRDLPLSTFKGDARSLSPRSSNSLIKKASVSLVKKNEGRSEKKLKELQSIYKSGISASKNKGTIFLKEGPGQQMTPIANVSSNDAYLFNKTDNIITSDSSAITFPEHEVSYKNQVADIMAQKSKFYRASSDASITDQLNTVASRLDNVLRRYEEEREMMLSQCVDLEAKIEQAKIKKREKQLREAQVQDN